MFPFAATQEKRAYTTSGFETPPLYHVEPQFMRVARHVQPIPLKLPVEQVFRDPIQGPYAMLLKAEQTYLIKKAPPSPFVGLDKSDEPAHEQSESRAKQIKAEAPKAKPSASVKSVENLMGALRGQDKRKRIIATPENREQRRALLEAHYAQVLEKLDTTKTGKTREERVERVLDFQESRERRNFTSRILYECRRRTALSRPRAPGGEFMAKPAAKRQKIKA